MKETRQQKGAALILVVWVVALLSLLAATALQITTTSAHITQAALVHAKLDAAADGAMNLALLEMIDPESDQLPWRFDGTPQNRGVGAYVVSVAIRDEGGKVDVNRAPASLISAVLRMSEPPELASEDARKIERFRTEEGSFTNAGSNVQKTYRRLFRTLNEVAVVAEASQGAWPCMRGNLTIYAGLESPNRAYASLAVRRALAQLSSTPTDSLASGDTDDIQVRSYAGRIFEIVAIAQSGGSSLTRRAVIRLTGDSECPTMVAAQSDEGDSVALPSDNAAICK